MSKPLPKSLHTVTVIVRVAKALRPLHPHATAEGLAGIALLALGYVLTDDPYGLERAAIAQLQAVIK
jgi:hypothetical protein